MFKILFWYWWALAAVLLVCEMLLPGVLFLFIAIYFWGGMHHGTPITPMPAAEG